MDKPNIIDSFSRLRDRLRGLAASILQDEDDADDALQEAFADCG